MERLNEMKIVFCFASYVDMDEMYFDTEDTIYDLDEIQKRAEKYYKSIGVEEFLLADTWSDDNDVLNRVIEQNYSEFFYVFLKKLKECIPYLENCSDEQILIGLEEGIKPDKWADIIIYGNTQEDVLEKCLDDFEINENSPLYGLFTNMFYWLNCADRDEFMRLNLGVNNLYDDKTHNTIYYCAD
jgi:hypothetical protein